MAREDHEQTFDKTGHSRAVLRGYARNNDLITATMPFAARAAIIDDMIANWSNTCTNPVRPPNTKQSARITPCGIGITIDRTNEFFKPLRKAMFDVNSHTWLCLNCYYARYPKLITSGWTSKLPKPKIQSARAIFEKTGKRYAYNGKKPLREIFDQSKANYSLTQTREGPWIKYRCPHEGCDFYLCARAFQGWPAHQCEHTTIKG